MVLRYLPVEHILNRVEPLLDNNETETGPFHIVGLLSDTDKTGTINLSSNTIASEVETIRKLLQGKICQDALPDILAPLINFSVNDHNKQMLGRLNIIPHLLRLLSLTPSDLDDLPRIAVVFSYVRQLASKVSF